MQLKNPLFMQDNPERGVTYWDWSLVPLMKGDGEVDSLIFTLLNVTERVKTKAELVENERFLTSMFNSVNDAIFTISMPDRVIRSANKAVSDLFGYKIDEIIGKQSLVFYPEEESFIEYGQHLSAAILEDMPFVREEFTLQKKDGQKIPCEIQTTILKQSGEVEMVISVVRDITERKEMIDEIIKAKEKAEASDSLKTAFINNISHEIRTPLNGILGFGQFLASPDLTENEREEYYAHVEQSSNRLVNTVTDYMDMALIYSGTMEINRKDLQFRTFFEKLIDPLRPRCEINGITLNIDIPEGSVDHELYTDSEFIRKVFSILFENALKFTQKGSISCGYRVLPGFVEVFVADTGKGIEANKLELIFEMFAQEDVSNTRGHEGSGLGLTIAKGLVRLLGGTIAVKSEKGKGSTFSFTIPLGQGGFYIEIAHESIPEVIKKAKEKCNCTCCRRRRVELFVPSKLY
jgi:PAS domain S-box-containing protein